MSLCNGLCLLLTTQIQDFMGTSREVDKFARKFDERSRQEEEIFNRIPMTKQERKKEKYMKKATNGYGECLIFCLYKSIKCTMAILLIFYLHLHLCLFFSRMQGLTESLFDEIKGLPFEDDTGEQTMGFKKGSRRNEKHGKLKKRKVCPFDFDPLKLLHENINNYTLFNNYTQIILNYLFN